MSKLKVNTWIVICANSCGQNENVGSDGTAWGVPKKACIFEKMAAM